MCCTLCIVKIIYFNSTDHLLTYIVKLNCGIKKNLINQEGLYKLVSIYVVKKEKVQLPVLKRPLELLENLLIGENNAGHIF